MVIKMKYREIYDYGRAALAEAGIAEAELDARLLLEYVCHTTRQELLAHGDRMVAETDYQEYVHLIQGRQSRIPLQHLTKEQEFMGLRFFVNEHVLIPRQDTEILVEEVMRKLQEGMRILDLCTGSGCILLSLLHYSNDCRGVGADISEKALTVARENARRLENSDVEFVQSDLLEQVKGRFDIIVSNPPYIKSEEIAQLMAEVKDHEPMQALDGGADGLNFYRDIIARAGEYLVPGGWLFFEIGYEQADAVSTLLEAHAYQNIRVVKDYAGLDRVVFGSPAGNDAQLSARNKSCAARVL